ncbi:MAG: energy transducer TonB [Vicinamibacterales bacterium]
MMRIVTFILTLIAASAAAATRSRQSVPPVTVGDIVLLSNSKDASVSAALRTALSSPDPAIRITAGRVTAILTRGDLRGALIGALARERDSAVGAELVRDILHLFGAVDLATVEQQSKRLGVPASIALAEWLARTQPARFAEREAEFASASQMADLVVMSARQHPEHADVIRRSWMAVASPGGWESVLAAALGQNDIGDEGAALLIDALHAPLAPVREESVWFVLQALVLKHRVPPSVVEAAAAPFDGASAWEAFGRELIARPGKPVGGQDRRDLIRTDGVKHLPYLRILAAAPQLSSAELDAVAAFAVKPREQFADINRRVAEARTPPTIAPGVVGATLRAANCRSMPNGLVRAALTYAEDGMPRRVSVDPTGLSQECQNAWVALARTTAVDSTEPVRPEGQVVMLPLNDDFIGCVDAAAESPVSVQLPLSTNHVAVPHKIRDVQPKYPLEAQERRIQGVVLIEAVISRTGCVSGARLLRSIPYLDAPAMVAVSRWKWEPTRVNDIPVPVFMTVTVNFELK